MKITKSKLNEIIKEEIDILRDKVILNEFPYINNSCT